MTKPQPSLLEVTSGLANRARTAHFSFGDDTAIVAVQHMLWQTLDLLEAVSSLGVKRENIFALGKVYSNSPLAMSALRNRGINVVESTTPPPGEFERAFQNDVNRLWEVVRRSLASRRIRRILILDDGGKCSTTIPGDLLARFAVAGVEQTSFGIFVFEETPAPFAVISWARSAVKRHIGGPLFSECLLAKVQSQFLQGKTLTGENVGIIGLGSIGSALATLVERQHNRVLFFEPDPAYEAPAYLSGRVTRVDSLRELMLRCDYVFGCSGRRPFKQEWPLAYRPGIKLFSASGGDQEFGAIIDDLKTRATFSVTSGTRDIYCEDGPSGPMFIAYLGYPYNFVSRAIEAVPTFIVQIETGGLLAALIQARTHLRLCDEGRATNEGLQRVSPEAQRFVFESWLKTMKDAAVDLRQVYGYDPALLESASDRSWLVKNSEPHPSLTYRPNRIVEAAMATMIAGRCPSPFRKQRQFEPDLGSF